jgi:hypothetical protein
MDSTNVWQPGFSIPEKNVYATLERIIRDASGRLIIAMFASHLERLIRVVRFAEESQKKVVIDGRSMRTNIEIARELGLIKYKDETVIQVEDIDRFPPEKILILATGAQGDEFASLARIGNKSHKHIRLNPKDTVVLSSSVIPGNERAVQKLKDNLSRQGAHIITYHASDVHASGHGNREEAVWIHKQIRPKFFIPVHGTLVTGDHRTREYHGVFRIQADVLVRFVADAREGSELVALSTCREDEDLLRREAIYIFYLDDGLVLVLDETELARDLDVGAHRAAVDHDLLLALFGEADDADEALEVRGEHRDDEAAGCVSDDALERGVDVLLRYREAWLPDVGAIHEERQYLAILEGSLPALIMGPQEATTHPRPGLWNSL